MPETPVSQTKDWLTIASSGGFAILAWYLITVQLPSMQSKFDANCDAQQSTFVSEMEKARTKEEKNIERMIQSYEAHQRLLLETLAEDKKDGK